MKKILVTGGAGFVGHKLVNSLLEDRANRVTVIDNFSFSDGSFIKKSSNLEILKVDIRRRKTILSILRRRKFDAVFHLAAIHFIPYCNQHPAEALETNVWGTRNILDGLRGMRTLKVLINISSMAVYGPEDRLHVEDEPLFPMDVYGRSKALAECLASLFHQETGVSTFSVRLSNAVGVNETNDHVVPAIVRQLAQKKKAIKLGNVSPRRNYIDTRDVCAALKKLMLKKPSGYHVVNLGAEEEYSVKDVVEIISEVLQRKIIIRKNKKLIRKSERQSLQPSLKRIMRLAHWRPHYSLKETLKDVLRESEIL